MQRLRLFVVMVLLVVGLTGCGAIQTLKESVRDSHTPVAQ